ncbi:MAG: RES family NAD+ phosphorylase [Pseudomonadota bacterium]|nr:RES family NAD+ phosphorylase [Pseudomonadota bacterium]MDP1904213.1 RES family NAD+ phosphorylase [Pseudomonadota bacterium]
MIYPSVTLSWQPAYRVIPSRFPAIGLFDRVAGPEDFDALYALESMTNDRLRDEVGEISLVPVEERLFGNGSSPIMAAFTHLNPQGSRFSDGTYGVFYCAQEKAIAIVETRYHSALFMGATNEQPMRLQMRLYTVAVVGEAVDLRQAAIAEPRIIDPDDYGYAQGLGRKLRAEGAPGILYPSVRKPGGECLAALRAGILSNCLHAAYLEYNWDGRGIDAVFEVSQL